MKDDEIKIRIAEVAKKEFMEVGYVDASMRNISAKAGLTTGSLYNRFKDKGELFEFIVGEGVNDAFEKFRESNNEFANKTLAEQKKLLSVYNDSVMKALINALYDNYDSFILVITKGTGSPYEHFIDKMVNIATDNIVDYITAKIDDPEVARAISHLLNATLFDAICEIFKKGYSREHANKFMEMIFNFYNAGWARLLND